MVYISGEEYTRHAAQLYYDQWIQPFVDTSKWEFYDLSVAARDKTDDQVLKDAISAGKRVGAIYKEPTVTPTIDQQKSMNLKKAWGSPNGAMRMGWNGISISRDTIHLPNMELGYKRQVLFDRHAVGGEYGAGFKMVGAGKTVTTFHPADGSAPITVDERKLTDKCNAVVTYHNPYDNVTPMAHHFFSRCLEAKVTPYVVTKKTVFKWQEEMWQKMRQVFNEHYKEKFVAEGLLKNCGGELAHYLSDVAAMKLTVWKDGGFGMCAHNYDGDVLTDELAQVHKSPGFLTSVLNGVNTDGSIIKEFEASHGTVSDMWAAHQAGKECSLNPLSMMEALIGAIRHSVILNKGPAELKTFSDQLQQCMHAQLLEPGKASRDISGPSGLTTEQFVTAVRKRLDALRS
jgi:isocitrate dehydrogenase